MAHRADYLTPSRAAELSGLSIRRIQQLCKTGKLKTVPVEGSIRYLITRRSFDAYAANTRKQAEKQRGRPKKVIVVPADGTR